MSRRWRSAKGPVVKVASLVAVGVNVDEFREILGIASAAGTGRVGHQRRHAELVDAIGAALHGAS